MVHITKEEEDRESQERQNLGDKEYNRRQSYMLHHKYDIWFYSSWGTREQVQISKIKPTMIDLLGIYDIVFVSGYNSEEIASRTARGTVVFLAGDKGTVELDDGGKNITNNFILFSDFHLSNFGFDEKDHRGDWMYTFDAMLEKYELGYPYFHQNISGGDNLVPRQGFIQRVENRAALPWIKYEHGNPYECCAEEVENGEVTKIFGSLEEAEKIHHDHEQRYEKSWLVRNKGLPQEVSAIIHDFHAYRPNPVFFIEPDDLILGVDWEEDDFWRGEYFHYILRKRKDTTHSGTRKRRNNGGFIDQEELQNMKRVKNSDDYIHRNKHMV